jgi:peptidoglycan hydrolase-like protein with peptidoglycan-binding domain
MRPTVALVAAALVAAGCQEQMDRFDRAMQGKPDPAAAPQKAVYSDPEVRDAQLGLQKLGYYDGQLDGIQGPRTRDAVRRFQIDMRRTPDGEVNKEVVDLMVKYIEINPPVEGRPKIADVFEAQRGLKRLGLYNGAVNGLYEQTTLEAVLRYRREAGLPISQTIDRQMLDRLARDVAALPTSTTG